MPTAQQGLLGVHQRDFYSAVDWWTAGTKVDEQLLGECGTEDILQTMSVRWSWGGKGKLASGGGGGKSSHSWYRGGGLVTRGHRAETHGNNGGAMNVGADKSDCASMSKKSLYYVMISNISQFIIILQRYVATFGNVLIRELVEVNRCGYNLSLADVKTRYKTTVSVMSDYIERASADSVEFVLWKIHVEPLL
jgi:hypothetical protein